MNQKQIKIDTYKELIRWSGNKKMLRGGPISFRLGYEQALKETISHLKGRIEELKKCEKTIKCPMCNTGVHFPGKIMEYNEEGLLVESDCGRCGGTGFVNEELEK